MLISKPYGAVKKTHVNRSRTRQPSRRFVELVEKSLSASDPIVTRITSDWATSGSDNFITVGSGLQTIDSIFHLHSGALGVGASDAASSLANQFCAYFNIATLSALTGDRTLHFIDIQSETFFTNMSNTTLDLDFWFVFPRRDTPAGAVTTAGAGIDSVFNSGYETVLDASFAAINDNPLTGVPANVDTRASRSTWGVLPYDARLFCQYYKLGKKISRQLLPGGCFTLRHGIDINRDISASDFFDASSTVGQGYTVVDMPGSTYGLICRMFASQTSEYTTASTGTDAFAGGTGTATHPAAGDSAASFAAGASVLANFSDPAKDVRLGSGKLGFKTSTRWRFHAAAATGITFPYVTVDPQTTTQTALSNEATMPAFGDHPVVIQFS